MTDPVPPSGAATASAPRARRHALVTGASLGIGAAVVRALATDGVDVALHCSRAMDRAMGHPDAADALAHEVQALGSRAVVIDRDLREPDCGRSIVTDAQALLGPLDILVICAAVQKREPFGQVVAEQLALQLRVNYIATVELLQAALPGMRARGYGRIVSIGSVNQVRPDPELAIYASLKSAVHNLIVNLAGEHAAHGITLNTVSPGLVETPRNAYRRVDAAAWREIQNAANPMHRAGMPDEVARVVRLLAHEQSAFITGTDFPVDGGARL
jgi:glucose 1-dehydrogenase